MFPNILSKPIYKENDMKNLLFDLVLNQIEKDIGDGDLTALEELLMATPIESLVGYLPEESVELINSMPIGVPKQDRFFTDDGSTAFFIDDKQVSCEGFNDYFDAHDVGWQEDTRTWNGKPYTVLTIFTDDRG